MSTTTAGSILNDVFRAKVCFDRKIKSAIRKLTPIVEERMGQLGVKSNMTHAPHSQKVRRVWAELLAEFFNSCPAAFKQLQAKVERTTETLGDKVDGAAHMLRILDAIGNIAKVSPEVKYVNNQVVTLLNQLGYRQRDMNSDQMAKHEAKQKEEKQGGKGRGDKAVSKETEERKPFVSAFAELCDTYKPTAAGILKAVELYCEKHGQIEELLAILDGKPVEQKAA